MNNLTKSTGYVRSTLADLAEVAADRLAEMLEKPALTVAEKRLADVVLGVLDRAGYAPSHAKAAGFGDVKDLSASELAQLRDLAEDLLAARALPVERKESAPYALNAPSAHDVTLDYTDLFGENTV